MAVDLHTHSRASDGSDPPARIIESAVAAGLTGVALTDHDTLAGISEARLAAASGEIRLVPGVELSVEWQTGPMHLLAYWIGPEPGPLQDRLAALRSGRAERNRQIVDALQAMGLDVTLEEVEEEAGGGTVGRPHIAAVLLRKGRVGTVAEAFDSYLARGRPAYRDRPRLSAAEAVHLTRESGGVAVVAHPHTVADTAGDFSIAFRSFADLGVAGIECHYSEYPPDLRIRLARMAEGLGLIATGGSDYHGRYKPGLALGTGRGDLRVPDQALADLESAR
jgi:predicted metal-dependent phosphoesterase TrpH